MLRCFSTPHSNFLLLNPEACDSSPRLILENLKTHLRRRRGTLDPEDSVRLGRTRSPTLLTPRDLDSASGIKRRPPRQSNPATDQPHIPRHSRPPYRLVQQHFCCSVCAAMRRSFSSSKSSWSESESGETARRTFCKVWQGCGAPLGPALPVST